MAETPLIRLSLNVPNTSEANRLYDSQPAYAPLTPKAIPNSPIRI